MWYFQPKDIKQIHFEITNFCNAKCPDCPREELGIDNTTGKSRFPDWIDSSNVSLDTIKRNFNQQITPNACNFYFCGCFGDALAHPNLIEILEYLISEFPASRITVATNGGLKTTDYWKRLSNVLQKAAQHIVTWGLDGLEDTNHIYRVNVKWKKVEENFRAFIAEGGKAVWQTIIFPHNYHQIEEIKKRAQDEGFRLFKTIYSYRHEEEVKALMPKELNHTVEVDEEFKTQTFKLKTEPEPIHFKGIPAEGFDYFVPGTNTRVVCDSQTHNKIFVKADGTVWPCNKIGAWRWRPDEGYYVQELKENLNADYINNINHFNLDEVMKNEYWTRVYDSHKNKSFCKSCVEECGRINDKDVYQTRCTEVFEEL